ncbi:TetR/AcrR family transcriptional regulator [Fusibacter sp. JL216-2]|uniref:TetR/AcrR family transcriptional regulator n=1 Tax=Fusibacter sp. JL216-2 TaxID=3071453 RepID=UPI003D3288C4
MKNLSTKERILVSAIKMFSKKGYSGASTSEIAKEAGCAEGTIFRYFPKKIDLLKHVAENFIIEFSSNIATKLLYRLLEESDDMTPEELVEALIRDRIMLVEKKMEILKIVVYEINFHDEVSKMFFDSFKANVEDIGAELVKVLAKKLDKENLDIYMILRTVFGQIAGIIFHFRLMGIVDEKEKMAVMDDMLKTSAQVVINGLKAV